MKQKLDIEKLMNEREENDEKDKTIEKLMNEIEALQKQ